ncbi:unnamed protein product [Rotaria sordida]|uniref:Uncharacterized protein n=1 Tax=Rotaria sordida TaxID=392033 RepID=A0A819NU66_9BILA|nr:unnamed protein product [Rotaria sordida]CAF3999800.1 unnamed protein product [Rotaria sordida]
MASNRAGKVNKGSVNSSSTKIIGSRHRSSEATHVLLRELSTRKLLAIQICFLSDAARLKPLTSGRHVSFRDGNGRGQKQGEILIVGTYDEVVTEMNNQTDMNLTDSPQKRPRQDDSFEKKHNHKRGLPSNSSISSNTVEMILTRSPSPLLSILDKDVAVPLSSPTPSFPVITQTTISNSLPSKESTTAINETTIQDNTTNTASLIATQQLTPLPSGLSPLIPTQAKTSINPSSTRPVVASTTIVRKSASSDALKEIKRLQSLVKSKDAEITKLTEEMEKLKEEVKKNAEYSILLPTDDVVIQWVDYLYESIHKAEIRNQLGLDTVATELNIERESLDLCLELGGSDRISTARQIFKQCIDYDEAIQQEHCWQNIDEDLILKICRFVREFFGVNLKFGDDYVRESLSNMMRKDSWKLRNPDKLKTKVKQSRSKHRKTSSKQGEETYSDGYNGSSYVGDDDDEHF